MNEFVARNGLIAQNDSIITGSLNVTGSQIILNTDDFRVDNINLNGSLIEASLEKGVVIRDSLTAAVAADFNNRTTKDSSNNNSIDWSYRNLISTDGATVTVNWDTNRLVATAGGGVSVDWQNRQLIKSDTTTVAFDWENGILTGSLYGTASWAENSTSSSYTLTASYALNGGTVTGGALSGSFGITIDGGGSAITTGNKGYLTVPYGGTITGWRIISDQSGSCVVDVWKTANAIPTVTNTIAGTEKPTLSSQQLNTDTALTTWTSSVSPGDIFAFNVDSATTVTRVNLSIYITKQ